MSLDLKSPKSVILPTPEDIKDDEIKSVFKKLMSSNEEDRISLYEDLKALWEILSGTKAMQNILDMGSYKINNVTDPAANQDAATKKYVDDLIAGTWTDYSATSTVTGWAAGVTKNIYYIKIGNLVFVTFQINGTSNATTVSFTLPYANQNGAQLIIPIVGTDNAIPTTSACISLAASGSTINAYKDVNGTVWTNSGTKGIWGQFLFKTT